LACIKIEKVNEIIAENKLKNKVSSLRILQLKSLLKEKKILITLWGRKV
jgi:hypothetical protein